MKRTVRSIDCPEHIARKVHLYCPQCRYLASETPSKTSENGDAIWRYTPQVEQLSRGKSPFPIDVVVQVGIMKFIKCMRRDEIHETLAASGVRASDGVISSMSMEFLARAKCLHDLRFDRIKASVEFEGGYVLGIDGTGDGGSDRIFVAMDLLRRWVLKSARIPSESTEKMRRHLESVKEKLGQPLANVSDMATSMMNVLLEVFPDVDLRVCHYHFVDDIGCDLMKKEYQQARKLIIGTRIQANLKSIRKKLYHELKDENIPISEVARDLRNKIVPKGMPVKTYIKIMMYDSISWILRYPQENKGLRFPYTLPYINLYERCRKGLESITAIREIAVLGRTYSKDLWFLESALLNIVEGTDKNVMVLRKAIRNVREGYLLFEELREILHIPKEKGGIPRDDLIIKSNENISNMVKELEEFRRSMREKVADNRHPMEKIVLTHLDKYWPYLILENVVVNVEGKDVLVKIPRTTSGNETCFGKIKTSLRKRLGKKKIGRELNRYGDYLPYVENLKSESYVGVLLESQEDLKKAFAELPPESVKEEMEFLREKKKGYDVTNSGIRGRKVEIGDIMDGVKEVERRVEDKLFQELFWPPEIYGKQSNGILTL